MDEEITMGGLNLREPLTIIYTILITNSPKDLSKLVKPNLILYILLTLYMDLLLSQMHKHTISITKLIN